MAEIMLEISPSTTIIKKMNTGTEVWATVQTMSLWNSLKNIYRNSPKIRTICTIPTGIPNTVVIRSGSCKGFGQNSCRPAECVTFDGCETGDCEGNYPASKEKYFEVPLDQFRPERAGQYHQQYSKQPDINQ